jgi:hypothetical protein
MKLRLPRRRVWRVAIYLGALLLVAIAIDLIVASARRTIRPSYLTTRIVQPRQPDGRIDYAAALDEFFSRGVTPANNAAVPLLQIFGPQALPTHHPTDGITNAMGMEPLAEEGDYFVAYDDFARNRGLPTQRQNIDFTQPFIYPTAVTPEIGEWVKAVDGWLSRVAEATNRTRFFIPIFGAQRTQTLAEVQIRHVRLMKDVGEALQARAIMRLNSGNPSGFMDDSLALHRLARLLSQGSTMVERVVAMSMEASTSGADVMAARSGKLSAAQAREMIDRLAAVGELPPYFDAIDRSERFLGSDVVQALAKLPPTEAGQLFNGLQGRYTLPAATFRFLPIPYERTLREMNQAYDGMLAATHQPTFPQRIDALKLWLTEVDRGNQSRPFMKLLSADWAVSLLLPSLERATVRMESARMQMALAKLALALAAFSAERGAYPASLAELSPAYLRDVPIDSFVERSLVYVREGNGYRLYSAGPNMKDDGGGKDDLLIEPDPAPATTKTSSTGPARS